jgi:hypothetical protein
MRYSFQVLNNSLPESIASGDFPSEQQMKAEAITYLLDLARQESRLLPCCLSLVARDEKGGVSALILSITDARPN